MDQLNLNFKKFRGTKKTWDSFIKPSLAMATPLISAAVAAKTKNPQSAQITNNMLKSLTRAKILSLTDMHGRGLRSKVMEIFSIKSFVINECLYQRLVWLWFS